MLILISPCRMSTSLVEPSRFWIVIFQSGAENLGELVSLGVVGASVVTSSTQADVGEVSSFSEVGIEVVSGDEVGALIGSIANVIYGRKILQKQNAGQS